MQPRSSTTSKRNIQGDITHILDNNGNVVVKYYYDAWGKCLTLNPNGTLNSSDSFIGNINPFRYRGYYYDVETGLFLLGSRYYDPEVGRFISPDDVSYLDPETINGLNLYSYCGSNPVMNIDPDGHAFFSILIAIGLGALIGGVVGGGFELSAQLIAGDGLNWEKIGLATLGGAVAGAITAIPIPGFQAFGVWGKVLSYGLTFVAGAAGTLAGGAITGAIDFTNGWSIAAGILIGGFANVAARGISDLILGRSASKIVNQGRKAKSLAIQKLQGHRLNMGASALKGGMRNAFKDYTKGQVMQLITNANPWIRYGIYASVNSSFLSGFPYMFEW